ncbi:hypothetical protein SETIT_5G221200v2 [Setaria italica]|uniref:DUF6598 domain-containing protein n=1 Tax=Setaria italica TaxID=4555 RepID=K3XRE9_SETIT|nr:hypothetical protein SETIT_5G221200v2 [Setaria italica]
MTSQGAWEHPKARVSICSRRFMEEIRCALEEALEEPDLKLKIIERPVEEEDGDEEGENGGGDEDEKNDGGEEEKNGGGGDNVEEDSEDDAEGWDENGDPCLPFIGSWDTPVLVCTAAAPGHPYFKPCEMMQVFSLRLSSPLAHPVNIYGTFSVRDSWEPLRNYLFKCSRDDPAMIPQSSPCRGIYVLQCFLIDIDLWIKEEGDGSADKQLFCGTIPGDCHGLDMHFAFLPDGIETVIEVLAEAEHPSDVKFSASTSGFDDKISLYDGNFCKVGPIFKHFMAVNKQEELHIILKMNGGSQCKWTFKAGVGSCCSTSRPGPGLFSVFCRECIF